MSMSYQGQMEWNPFSAYFKHILVMRYADDTLSTEIHSYFPFPFLSCESNPGDKAHFHKTKILIYPKILSIEAKADFTTQK